ncbi:hypothetical protein D3C81_2157840 [compost metagenome]
MYRPIGVYGLEVEIARRDREDLLHAGQRLGARQRLLQKALSIQVDKGLRMVYPGNWPEPLARAAGQNDWN